MSCPISTHYPSRLFCVDITPLKYRGTLSVMFQPPLSEFTWLPRQHESISVEIYTRLFTTSFVCPFRTFIARRSFPLPTESCGLAFLFFSYPCTASAWSFDYRRRKPLERWWWFGFFFDRPWISFCHSLEYWSSWSSTVSAIGDSFPRTWSMIGDFQHLHRYHHHLCDDSRRSP